MFPAASSSVSAGGEVLGHIFNKFIAVAGVLELLVGHDSGLVPHAEDEALVGSHGAGTATALSSEVDRVVLGVVLDEHVLLVGDSDAGLATLPVTLGGLKESLELVHGDLLLGAVLLRHVVLVSVKGEAGSGGPSVAVVTVDGGELAHVGEGVLLGGSVVLVLDLMEICVPT